MDVHTRAREAMACLLPHESAIHEAGREVSAQLYLHLDLPGSGT